MTRDDTAGLPMPPMGTAPNGQHAGSSPHAASTTSRKRQKSDGAVPIPIHGGITPAMNRAIERLSAGNSLLAGADILRLALHGYLLQNDPHYRHELSNGGG